MWRALDSADERVVRNMYSKAFYSPTGHLLFRLGGPVVAQQFDASSGTVSGDPVQLLGDTVKEGSRTSLAFSPAGVLAHRAGSVSAVAQLSWIDRDGKVLATVGAAADYRNAAIDRAGERVVANTVQSLGRVAHRQPARHDVAHHVRSRDRFRSDLLARRTMDGVLFGSTTGRHLPQGEQRCRCRGVGRGDGTGHVPQRLVAGWPVPAVRR